jgi:outer membrane protein OmpA-like peptidoglycan-associated protein
MRTYHECIRGRSRGLALLGSLVLLLAGVSGAAAQQRKYLVELGAAGVYQSFDEVTALGGGTGGAARIGLWLPANFGVEGEGWVVGSSADVGGTDVSVKTFSLSALYNFLVGTSNTIYLKAGGGSTKYGSDCPGPSEPAPPFACGSIGTLVLATGARVAVTPTLMVRGEGQFNRNSTDNRQFSNFGVNLGLSLMLGSKPIDDSDSDGILNNRDRCANTPAGAQVDGRGCPSDDDNDGVPNGVDRCPTTSVGATVDASGCTRDSDGDNIADGLDRCPDTPTGVLVDPRGCPRDSDDDSIPDGIDRCSDTPSGATVDALGCPGDEDGDGVLDGLDRCPRSPVGARVSPAGCAAGQEGQRAAPVPSPSPSAAAPQPSAGRPAPARQPAAQAAPTQPPAAQPPPTQQPSRPAPSTPDSAAPARPGTITPGVIPGVEFAAGTARLTGGSYVALDSIVRILLASPTLRIEVGAHTDNSGPAAETLHLTNLQAEAVRNYLVTKGVPFQQVVPRGYGATVPLTPDTTPRGRAANRRVEIRQAQTGP